MPPRRLYTLRNPREMICSAAAWLRMPWWQTKTSVVSFGKPSSSAAGGHRGHQACDLRDGSFLRRRTSVQPAASSGPTAFGSGALS